MRFGIGEHILARCSAYPDRLALEDLGTGHAYTYQDIQNRLLCLKDMFANVPTGQKGRTVGVLFPNGVDAALILPAAQLAGVIAVPINGRLTQKEIAYILGDADCRAVCSSGEYLVKVKEICKSREIELIDAVQSPMTEPQSKPELGQNEIGNKPCVIGYTSGTTGFPKGAIYSNDYFVMNNYRWGWEFGLTSENTVLITGPMFHISFAGFAIAALMIGARVRILPAFDAELAFEDLSKESTFAFMVPAMIFDIANVWEKNGRTAIGKAGFIISAGAPLPMRTLEGMFDMFPNARIAEMYGSTEGGFVTYEVKNRDTLLPHSVGWPAIGADVCVFDHLGNPCKTGEAGEIGVKSTTAFLGYLGKPAETAATMHKGYVMSGDIGIWQDDGRLCLVDRKKDVIISGGENVYTAEIERVLLEHPDIAEAAIVGIEDERLGEMVTAAIVFHKHSDADPDMVISFCRDSLASYKIPRCIVQMDELPRNSLGKVQKFKLVEALSIHAK